MGDRLEAELPAGWENFVALLPRIFHGNTRNLELGMDSYFY